MADPDDSRRRSSPPLLPKISAGSLSAEQAALDAQQAANEDQTNSLVRWSSDPDAPPEVVAERRRMKKLRDDVITHASTLGNSAKPPTGRDPELKTEHETEILGGRGASSYHEPDENAQSGISNAPFDGDVDTNPRAPITHGNPAVPADYVLVSTKDPPSGEISPTTEAGQASAAAPKERRLTPELPPVAGLGEERRSTEVYEKLFAANGQAPGERAVGQASGVDLPPVTGYFDDPSLQLGQNRPELAQDMRILDRPSDLQPPLNASTIPVTEEEVTPLTSVSPTGLSASSPEYGDFSLDSDTEVAGGGRPDKSSPDGLDGEDGGAARPTSMQRKLGGLGVNNVDRTPSESTNTRKRQRRRSSSVEVTGTNKRLKTKLLPGTDFLETPSKPPNECVEVGNETCKLSMALRNASLCGACTSSESSEQSSFSGVPDGMPTPANRSLPVGYTQPNMTGSLSEQDSTSTVEALPKINSKVSINTQEDVREPRIHPMGSSNFDRKKGNEITPRSSSSKLISTSQSKAFQPDEVISTSMASKAEQQGLLERKQESSSYEVQRNEDQSSRGQQLGISRSSLVDADESFADRRLDELFSEDMDERSRSSVGLSSEGTEDMVIQKICPTECDTQRSSLCDHELVMPWPNQEKLTINTWNRSRLLAYEYLRPLTPVDEESDGPPIIVNLRSRILEATSARTGLDFRAGSGDKDDEQPSPNDPSDQSSANEEEPSRPRYTNERVASIIQSLRLDTSSNGSETQPNNDAATVVLGPDADGSAESDQTDESSESDNPPSVSWGHERRIVWGARSDDSADSEVPPDPPKEASTQQAAGSPKITHAPIVASDDDDNEDQEEGTGRRRTVVWAGSLTLIPIPSRADIAEMYPSSDESPSPPPPPPKPIFSKWEENRFFSDDSDPDTHPSHLQDDPSADQANDDEPGGSPDNMPPDVPRIGDNYYEKAMSGFKWSTQVASQPEDYDDESPPASQVLVDEETPDEEEPQRQKSSFETPESSTRASDLHDEPQKEKHTQTEVAPHADIEVPQSPAPQPEAPGGVKNEVRVENIGVGGAVRCRVQIGGVKKFQAPPASAIANPNRGLQQNWQQQPYSYPQQTAAFPAPQMNMEVWLPVRKISVDLQGNCHGQPWSTAQVLVQPCYMPSVQQYSPGALQQTAPSMHPSFPRVNADPAADITVDISHDFNMGQPQQGVSGGIRSHDCAVPCMSDPTGCQEMPQHQQMHQFSQISQPSTSDMAMPHSCSDASPIPWISSPVVHCLPSTSAGSVSDRTYAGSAAQLDPSMQSDIAKRRSQLGKVSSSSLLPSFRDKCGCDGAQQEATAMPVLGGLEEKSAPAGSRKATSRSRVCPISRRALQRANSIANSKLSHNVEKESKDWLSVFKMFKFHNHNYSSLEAIFNNQTPQLTPSGSDEVLQHQNKDCSDSTKEHVHRPLAETGDKDQRLEAVQQKENDAPTDHMKSPEVLRSEKLVNSSCRQGTITMDLMVGYPQDDPSNASLPYGNQKQSIPEATVAMGIVNAACSPARSHIVATNRKVCDLIRRFESKEDSDRDLRRRGQNTKDGWKTCSAHAMSNMNRILDHGDSQEVVLEMPQAEATYDDLKENGHAPKINGSSSLLPQPGTFADPEKEAHEQPLFVSEKIITEQAAAAAAAAAISMSQEFKIVTEPFPAATADFAVALAISDQLEQHLAASKEGDNDSVSLQKSSTVHLFRRGSGVCGLCTAENWSVRDHPCTHEAFTASSHMAPYQPHLQLMDEQELQELRCQAVTIKKFVASGCPNSPDEAGTNESTTMPKKAAGSCPNVMQPSKILSVQEKKHAKVAYSLLMENERKPCDVHGAHLHSGNQDYQHLGTITGSRAFETAFSDMAKASAAQILGDNGHLEGPHQLKCCDDRTPDESTLISDHLGDSTTAPVSDTLADCPLHGEESELHMTVDSPLLHEGNQQANAAAETAAEVNGFMLDESISCDECSSMEVNFSGALATQLAMEKDMDHHNEMMRKEIAAKRSDDVTTDSFDEDSSSLSGTSFEEQDSCIDDDDDGSFVEKIFQDMLAYKCHLEKLEGKAEIEPQSSGSSFESNSEENENIQLPIKQDEPSTVKTDTDTAGTLASIPPLVDWVEEGSSADGLEDCWPMDKTQQDVDTSIGELAETVEDQELSLSSVDSEVAMNKTLKATFCSTFETGIRSPSMLPAGLNKEISLDKFVVDKKKPFRDGKQPQLKRFSVVPRLHISRLRPHASAVQQPDIRSRRLKEQKHIISSINEKATSPTASPIKLSIGNEHTHFKQIKDSAVQSSTLQRTKWLPATTFKRTARTSVETLKQCPVHSTNPFLDMLSNILDGRMSLPEAGKVLVRTAVKQIGTQIDKEQIQSSTAATMISSLLGKLKPGPSQTAATKHGHHIKEDLKKEKQRVMDAETTSSDDCLKVCRHEKVKFQGEEGYFWACFHGHKWKMQHPQDSKATFKAPGTMLEGRAPGDPFYWIPAVNLTVDESVQQAPPPKCIFGAPKWKTGSAETNQNMLLSVVKIGSVAEPSVQHGTTHVTGRTHSSQRNQKRLDFSWQAKLDMVWNGLPQNRILEKASAACKNIWSYPKPSNGRSLLAKGPIHPIAHHELVTTSNQKTSTESTPAADVRLLLQAIEPKTERACAGVNNKAIALLDSNNCSRLRMSSAYKEMVWNLVGDPCMPTDGKVNRR